MKNTHTESAPAMIIWLLVPLSILIAILTYSCECPAQTSLKPVDVANYEKEIKSAPEYQLIRIYKGGKKTETQMQYQAKNGKWKRVIEKAGKWTKADTKKLKIINDVVPIRKTTTDTGEDPIMAVLSHPDREEVVTIVTLPGYQAHYTKVVTIQAPALEDGSTTCKVTHEKIYIGNRNQGYSAWVEGTEI